MVVVVLAACGGDKVHERHVDEHLPAGSGTQRAREQGDHVSIAPEMLRDLRITTAKVESRAAGERVSVLADVRVNQDAYAEVASPTTARVLRVLAKAGDEVKAGQPLVELASADVSKARGEVQAAEERVAIANQNLARKQALHADRLIPERDVIEARAAVKEAEAARTAAAGQLQPFAVSGAGGVLVLRAQVGGTVIERDVVVGQLADPSKTLFRIGDLSKLWLVAHVFERDAVRVQLGATGAASFAALPGRTIEGPVVWIGREVETPSRTIPVRLELANPGGVLRPGMSAMVSLPVGEPGGPVIAVPMAAVQRVGDRWAVFIPRGVGEFDVRTVGRGRELGGDVEILSGVAAGEEVVVDGAFLLKAEFDKASGEGGHDHEH